MNKKKKRILHICTTASVGGAENHLAQLLPLLVQSNLEVGLFYLKDDGALQPYFQEKGIDCRRVKRLELYKKIKEFRPDIVHTHLVEADWFGIFSAFLAGVPIRICTHHDDDVFRHKKWVKAVERVISLLCHKKIAISRHIAHFLNQVEGIPSRRIRVIRYGYPAPKSGPKIALHGSESAPAGPDFSRLRFETRAKLGLKDDDFMVLNVGRLVPQKAQDDLIRAMALLAPKKNIKAFVLGDGYLHSQLKNMALDLNSSITFLGFDPNTAAYYAAADLFCLPSAWEGLGLVLLEAMEAHLPIVATKISAIPESVKHGKNGLLVPVGDHFELASAILRLYENKEERQRLAQGGRKIMKRYFSLEKMLDKHLSLYKELAN